MVPAFQKPAPEFSGMAVVNEEFKKINLSDYKGKYVLLFFYQSDFTFVCPTEVIAFSDRVEEFRKIGYEIIACSTDSEFSHLAWKNTPRKKGGLGALNIPLLSDKSMEIARNYGVLDENSGIPSRGLFIIDPVQNLRHVTVTDSSVGRSVNDALRVANAIKHTDVGNWKPRNKTTTPNPEKSKQKCK